MTRIEFAGHYDEAIFLTALRCHYRPLRRATWVLLGMVALLDAAACLAAESFADALSWLVPSLIVVAALIYFLYLPRRQARIMARSPLARSRISGDADGHRLSMTGETLQAQISWHDFRAYTLAADLVLLYHGKNAFNIIPRRWFGDERAWDEFLSLMQTGIAADKESVPFRLTWWQWLLLLVAVLLLLALFLPPLLS
ncbi:MAG: YcxB family protein [Caldilineae bacterium]|nr:MAG: YcxB family protein [Caldilineae bacterium]